MQQNKDFQDGKFDLDGLCSELRSKARCSESGVVVPEDYVDQAFKKLSGHKTKDNPSLIWEQDYVDAALHRLGAGGWPNQS